MTPNDFLKESKLNEFLTLANTLPISENQAKNCMSLDALDYLGSSLSTWTIIIIIKNNNKQK